MLAMLIHSTIKATLWLAIGFGLSACSAAASPAFPSPRPVGSTGAAIIESPEPATATIIPNFESPEPATDSIIPNTQTPIPPTVTSIPAASLPDLGPAPDFTNEIWLNSDRPLNLASLQGKVVLVEFWTFG
jgi:hypothetical protein